MIFKRKPREHQLKAWRATAERTAAALLMDAGTGKTKVITDTAAHLYLKREIDTLVVAAPNGVHRNWIGEIDKDMSDDVDYASAFWGPRSTDREYFTSLISWKNKPCLRVWTINIEALSLKGGREILEQAFKSSKLGVLFVIDESHKIKTPGSARTKSCYALGMRAKYRRILTGTPTTKGYEDLYAQFKFLDWRIINCKTYAEFRARYCKMGGYEMRSIVGYHDVDDLLRRIAKYSFEAKKSDCYDLPPMTIIPVEVPLSAEQERLYRKLKDETLLELSKMKTIELEFAMTRAQKLQGIVSGFVGEPKTGVWEPITPNAKLDRLVDILEDVGTPKVLIWCLFRADVQMVHDRLVREGYKPRRYFGGNQNTRWDELQEFKTNQEVGPLILTRSVGATGLTINEATYAINYSLDWKYEEREQSLARNYRDGQTLPVTVYDLIAPKTADVRIMKTLTTRENISESMKSLEAFRRLVEEL